MKRLADASCLEYFDQLEDIVPPTVYRNLNQMRETITLDDPLLITAWRHDNLRSFVAKTRAYGGQINPPCVLTQPITEDSLAMDIFNGWLQGAGQVRSERDIGMSLIGPQFTAVIETIGEMNNEEWFRQVDVTAIHSGQVVSSFPVAHHYTVPKTGGRDARCRVVSIYRTPRPNRVFQ